MKRTAWMVLASLFCSTVSGAAEPLQNIGSLIQRDAAASVPTVTSLPTVQSFTFAGRSFPAIQAMAKPIDPESYVVGPGDGLQIQVWGGVDLLHEVIISAEGKIVVPTIGTLDVKGKTLNAVQEMVTREAAHYYRGANIAVSLAVLRAFEVFVLGEVNKPGIYPATPVTRVTELLDQAGGIAPSGSPRLIEIRRADAGAPGEATAIRVDISRFLFDGILEENPFVRDGTTIFAPLNKGTSMIEGSVQRPGTYTLREGDTVETLIAAAGGLKPDAGRDQMRLRRGPSDVAVAGAPAGAEGIGRELLRDGDRVTVPATDGRTAPIPVIEAQVYVVGNVKAPGPYAYVRNRSVMDYVGLAGGGDERAKLSAIVVYRREEPLPARAVEAVQPGDMIQVPEKRLKWWQDYVAILTAISSVVLSAIAVSLAAKK